jgi:hypothetical protein
MVIKSLAFAIAALMLISLGLPSIRAKSAVNTHEIPEGVRPGELSALERCEFRPDKKTRLDAECGTLTVPENWDDPDSHLISLPLVRIPASGPNPAEPIFWLQGGPGTPNLTWAPPAWLLRKHDMPDRWLFLLIDADTVRMGTRMMFFASGSMSMALDMYLAAGRGDYSGLA